MIKDYINASSLAVGVLSFGIFLAWIICTLMEKYGSIQTVIGMMIASSVVYLLTLGD